MYGGYRRRIPIQYILAQARQRSERLKDLLTNQPVLLMENGRFRGDAMAASRVSRSNVLEKLRAANVTDFTQVRAVVLETTRNISVVHGSSLDPRLIGGVRRVQS